MPRKPKQQPDTTPLPAVSAALQEKVAAHHKAVAAWKLRKLRRIMAELARRDCEPLRLYEPLPAFAEFHKCRAQERALIGGNRGGKTTAAVVEFVKIITGQHDDPKFPKTNGRAYLVAKDEKQIAGVFYRKLFRPGLFDIIRDEQTGRWRVYRPDQDAHRAHEKKPAPPLIPTRLLKGGRKGISFRLKKDNVFRKFTLVNGWEIEAFPAGGDAPRGTDIHLSLFDENVPQNWYDEITARLMQHSGSLIWSATPQDEDCEALANLAERAEREAESDKPSVVRFSVKLDDNVFMAADKKREFKQKWENDPEQYRIRVEGEFASFGLLVFPEFHAAHHGVTLDRFPKGRIPANWTRYCAVDPGNRVCAVVFLAVPPPDDDEHGKHFYLYDELYIEDADHEKLGKRMAEKVDGQRFHACIIDDHGSRRSEFGGKTIRQQAAEAFQKYKVWDAFAQKYFVPGSDDVEGRVAEVRSWLRGEDPKLRVVLDTTPHFQREIRRYKRKVQRIDGRSKILDQPDPRSPWSHAQDCLQYLAHYRGLRYRRAKPRSEAPGDTELNKWVEQMKRRNARAGSGNHVNLSA